MSLLAITYARLYDPGFLRLILFNSNTFVDLVDYDDIKMYRTADHIIDAQKRSPAQEDYYSLFYF